MPLLFGLQHSPLQCTSNKRKIPRKRSAYILKIILYQLENKQTDQFPTSFFYFINFKKKLMTKMLVEHVPVMQGQKLAGDIFLIKKWFTA